MVSLPFRTRSRTLIAVAFLLMGVADRHPARAATPDETATAAAFEHIRHDPARLELFLRAFPKGADLHNHLAGAVSAESLLAWAAEDGLCVSVTQGRILPGRCRAANGEMPARDLLENDAATHLVVDALSMRDFVPTETDRSGHDHFFATFDRYAPLEEHHQGDMLAEALDNAARDNVLYVELMVSPALGSIVAAGLRHPLHGDDLAAARAALAPDMPQLVSQARTQLDAMEARAHAVLACGTPQAHPGCGVQTRYLYASLRTLPPAATFAQIDASYEIAHADPRFVGVNLVAPEDDPTALREYDLHMRMYQLLGAAFPEVPLSLHAGELAKPLVPDRDLRDHIRKAVMIAGARRIGHGVDIAGEDGAADLLGEMARRGIAVEIALASNAEILGVSGTRHPFDLYRRAGVPVALSSDDEGVSRSDLTAEYRQAVETWPLSYADLKTLSRDALSHSFLPGASLWEGDHMLARCQALQSYGCTSFLHGSPKAQLQLALERRFQEFEASARQERLFQ